MKIISHRGYWKTPEEKNSPIAFDRSFSMGFGTETDIRDYAGALVISHDIAHRDCESLSSFLALYRQEKNNLPLALNIKADGLQAELKAELLKFEVSNYFAFDMSIPDTIGYVKNKLKFFSRQSEYEQSPVFYNHCSGIWLDAFIDIWYKPSLIRDHISKKKEIAIVSPELHGREPEKLWEFIRKNGIHRIDGIIICTDLPVEALSYFEEIYVKD